MCIIFVKRFSTSANWDIRNLTRQITHVHLGTASHLFSLHCISEYRTPRQFVRQSNIQRFRCITFAYADIINHLIFVWYLYAMRFSYSPYSIIIYIYTYVFPSRRLHESSSNIRLYNKTAILNPRHTRRDRQSILI